MKLRYCALAIATVLAGCNSDSENPAQGNNGQDFKAPIASSVAISGDALVGSTLTGKYSFTDPNYSPRPEGESQYQWRQADADEDTSNDKVLGDSQTLALADSEFGQNVYFCVTPAAEGNVNIIGEEKCSASVNVQSGAGEKPQADNVSIDNMEPTVGDTLTGDYTYSDPDGDTEAVSQFVWKSNGKDIDGANQQGFTLTATQEGISIQFCVTPISENPDALPNYPVTGDQACSEATAAVKPKTGSAPVATDVTTSGDHTVGSVITGQYSYEDADNDKEGQSQRSWKRDGVELPGETASTYTLAASDKGASVEFCVTPVAATGLPTQGNETCADPITDVTEPVGDVPTITLGVVTSDGDVQLAQVGDTLTGSYQYQPSSSGAADDSKAVWKAGDQVIASATCTTGQACDLTIGEQQLGQSLTYCVTPKATDSQTGAEQCSPAMDTFGIRISGKLEFGQNLEAETFGYTNPQFSWKVDTTSTDGPAGDTAKTEKATASVYSIGHDVLAHITPEFESTQGNNNGMIDDADWDQALRQGVVNDSTVNAAHYVGKDVQLCVTTDEAAEQCLLASAQPGVSGGVLYNKDDFSLRAIEPVREVTFKGAVYHRPLSIAEMETGSDSDFGPLMPKAHYSQSAMGIDWASLKLEHTDGTKPGLEVCLNLYKQQPEDSSTWFLPASRSDSAYTPNAFDGQGNQLPVDDVNTYLIKLANIYNTKDQVVGQGLVGNLQDTASPVFGWVTNSAGNTPFWSATKPNANLEQANSVKFYDSGSSGNNAVGNGRFVTCIRAAG
ncbi:hypothetical protein [Photobacterium lutimaris]|uniref:Uncharacterized protein n=1 Tax=Photobacterium lutimaris TaxID=388278 RepID=A0A2T3J2C9_9GAMM|nr:hypothetical protein [Photobacterium lutimaris]PSU35449.1 hypothetical protein C9I99_00010 [Photobacterium lutimaris]TDR78495.1 hypothetical protein DFP78_1013 [Photobacterium lutimaris]